jgi:SSS family solute:Na+ symporter
MAGLYARAALPDLSNPTFSYPLLAELTLPSVAKGLFYVGMLATIMSTLSSLMFISASTIGRDIVARFASPADMTERESLIHRWTRVGLILSAACSIILALVVPSVVKIWYTIGTAIIPGLLVPLMASYFEPLHIPPRYGFWAMALGWGVSTVSLLVGQIYQVGGEPSYLFGIEPMYPGLAISMVIWGIGRIQYRKQNAIAGL